MLQTATKSDLMQIIDDERDWWDTLVARATPDQMESIKITSDWTIRDLAAHLLSWWEWRLARLDAAVNNQPKPDPPYPANLQSIDQQNAWFHQQKQSRSAEDLTRAFSESFDQLKAIVSRLSEDERTSLPIRTAFPSWMANLWQPPSPTTHSSATSTNSMPKKSKRGREKRQTLADGYSL